MKLVSRFDNQIRRSRRKPRRIFAKYSRTLMFLTSFDLAEGEMNNSQGGVGEKKETILMKASGNSDDRG